MEIVEIDFCKLDALAASLMKERKAHAMRETGFIYWHGRRTSKCVIALRKRTLEDDSHDNALRIAAMFHDVGKGIEPHAESGAVLAMEFLRPYVAPSLLEEVAYLIREHNNHQNTDIFVQLLQDADILDHFGSIEIGLSFQYCAHSEHGMQATLDWYQNEFDAYVKRVHSRLKLSVSRVILDEKVTFTHAFVRRFEKEMAGEFLPDTQDISLSEMLAMQEALQAMHKEDWTPLSPETARSSMLWMVEELGEAAAVIKKKGDRAIMENQAVRGAFIEEMADVLMYFSAALLCYNITEDEMSRAFREKHSRNLGRSYRYDDK